MCYVLCVMCYVSCAMCHVLCVMCYVSCAMGLMPMFQSEYLDDMLHTFTLVIDSLLQPGCFVS